MCLPKMLQTFSRVSSNHGLLNYLTPLLLIQNRREKTQRLVVRTRPAPHSEEQHSFVKHRSTDSNVLDFTSFVLNNLIRGKRYTSFIPISLKPLILLITHIPIHIASVFYFLNSFQGLGVTFRRQAQYSCQFLDLPDVHLCHLRHNYP